MKRKFFQTKHGPCARLLSWVLAFAMIITMSAFSSIGTIVAEAADGIKLYFELPSGTSVSDWGVNAWGDNIAVTGNDTVTVHPNGWQDSDNFPSLLTDASLSGWGYVTVAGTIQGLQFVNTSGGENCWNAEIKNQGLTEAYYSPDTGKWYKEAAKTTEIKEPEIQNIFVVAGDASLTGTAWSNAVTGNDANVMKQDASNANKYSVTYTNVPAGSHEYQILQDPANKGWDLVWWGSKTNHTLTLTSVSDVTLTIDLTDSNHDVDVKIVPKESLTIDNASTFYIEKNTATVLPTSAVYSNNGVNENVTVTYAPKGSPAGVTLNGSTITVTASVAEVTLTATASSKSFSTDVTFKVVDKLYHYTIYYHDFTAAHMSVEATDLWFWENGGTQGNVGYPFSSKETLSDDNEWLKAEISVPYTNLGMIARSKGGWTWQTGNIMYNNTAKTDTTLYLVSNKTTAYTELPELVAPRGRYVLVEYDRPANDYDGWNIYSWNTGLGSETELYTELINGKRYITVPIADYEVDLNLAFCMRKTTESDAWAEKDGGDHYITVPADQTVVKAKFVQGKGITEILPYNTGCKLDGANSQIHFYYRDDELFKECKEDSLQKVQLYVNGTTYDMTYDSANERYVYDLKNIQTGDYHYYYKVTDSEGNTTEVLDAYNENTATYEGKECSVVTYKNFANLSINASLTNATMDYNDNNVLSVNLAGADAGNITVGEIESITAGLSSLGVADLQIKPELMKGTISCLYTTSVGSKSIPVTMTDIYGNIYRTTVSVQVTQRVKQAGDFDWDEAIIYFAVTDRFFDGDESNNNAYGVNDYNPDPATGGSSYHGGDFAGLTQKLDYLKDLGVNTIWITPIVENITGDLSSPVGLSAYGYTGYWASDFTTLNQHLGTEAQFKALLNEAHSRDMKIMVDVVLNHAGYNTESYFNSILQDAEGNPVKMIRDAGNTVTGSDVYAPLSGLPDFVTEDPMVRAQLVEWQTDWIEKYDIDYYRVDTVKHVDSTTWAAFKNSLTEANPDFKMIGEYAGADYASATGELGTGSMDSLLDFGFNDYGVNFVTGGISDVENSLLNRNGAINNTATLGSFLNSHDEDGLQFKLQDEKGLTEEETMKLMKVAASLSITAKGQPVIYYGEELGQYGEENYPYQTNRYDFDWDELAAQQEDSNSIYNHYKKMLEIRNTYTDVFARGDRKLIANSNTDGYDVFSRSYNGTTLYVGLNIKAQEKTVNVKLNGGVGAVYKDLYSGTEYTASSDTVSVTIPAAEDGGTVVLVCTKAGTSSSGGSSSSDGTNVTTVTNNPDGTSTTATVIKKVNSAGKTVEVTTSVTKAEDGSVIGTKEVTVIDNPAKDTSVVVSVQKDADGTVKEAVADVTKTGTVSAKDTKVTVSAAVTAQIKEAAGTDDVIITTVVTDGKGSEKYTVSVNARNLVTGRKLNVVAVDEKTGEYVLVNAKTYTVNEKGNVTVTLPDGKKYVLISSTDAKKVSDAILKTIKVKKSSKTVKVGKKTTIQLSDKLNMDNVKKITYTSSNKKVATVDKNGKVKAKKAGTVTIKAKVTLNNGKTKTVTMKVKVKK